MRELLGPKKNLTDTTMNSNFLRVELIFILPKKGLLQFRYADFLKCYIHSSYCS